MSKENSLLASGVEFSVYHLKNPNKVAKFAHFAPLYDPETPLGRLFYERTVHDYNLISNYLGQDYLGTTRVRKYLNRWWIEQDYLDGAGCVSYDHPMNSEIRPLLQNLALKAQTMRQETGYALDWHGFGGWPDIPKILVDQNYWKFRSLHIAENETGPKIQIVDTGL